MVSIMKLSGSSCTHWSEVVGGVATVQRETPRRFLCDFYVSGAHVEGCNVGVFELESLKLPLVSSSLVVFASKLLEV